MRNSRLAMLATCFGIVASMPAVLGADGSSFGPAVRGRMFWASSDKGTYNVGNNATKRARRAVAKAERAGRLERIAAGDFTLSRAKLKNQASII